MIEGLDGERLAALVAAMWERQGWTTRTVAREGDRFVAVSRADPESERGLILVVADPEGTIGTKRLAAFHEFCAESGAGEAAVVTTGSIAPGAVAPAEGRGVGLLDGDDLREVVRTHGLADLVEEHAGGAGSGADSPADRLKTMVAALPDGLAVDGALAAIRDAVAGFRERDADAAPDDGEPAPGRPVDLPVPGRVVVAAVAVLAIVVAGVLVGPSVPLPFLGGDEAPGDPVTARTVAPANGEGVLLVSWDATRREVIDPDPDDGAAYYPRENRTFLVVELTVTNAGGGTVPVHPEGFIVEDNGTVRGHQPLAGTTGFEGRDLVPGDTLTGWIAFSVDPDPGALVLTADGNAFGPDTVTIQFSRDAELDVPISANATA